MTQSSCRIQVLLLLTAMLAPVQAQESLEPPKIRLVEPPPSQPIFGTVTLRAEVRAEEPVVRVSFRVDGHHVGSATVAPWAVRFDVGEENRPHLLEAVVETSSGLEARASLLTPPIHIDEELDLGLQQLYVTITLGRRRVLNLTVKELTVLDEGREQKIVTLERGNIPFSAMLLLDGSGSMQGRRLAAALAGARAFISDLRYNNRTQLLVMADRLLAVSPEVERGGPIAETLDRTAATGGTALYDHLFLALENLEHRQGRRVIVMLTDGYDTVSILSMDKVHEVVRQGQTMLYWVRLVNADVRLINADHSPEDLIPLSAWHRPRDSRRDFQLLARTVRESGGRIVDLTSTEEIEPAFREILAELREQVAIGYFPEPRRGDGAWRRVEVRVRRPGLKLRYRDGYFDR